jgi:TolB-like protein/Tfp pilus assembly protein PilF
MKIDPPPPSLRRGKHFFAELKRRNVYKVAVAYAVIAWLLIQAASIILPAFEAPPWSIKVLIAALAIGFPIVVVLAWAFEITPEGIVRAEDVAASKSITRKTGRKLTAIIVIVAVIAAALFAFQFYRPKASVPDARAVAPILEKSIAVLPFENRSEDKANAYFADGIQDEILTRLARIGALKVISRTSTEKYRSRPDNLKVVAEELGVTALLEGSVQKSGSKVRVIVQLIEASSDRHLWAETYDRSLDDVFTVQSEIAEKVASALRANLTPQESVALKSVPTRNQKAYDLFLRAEHFVRIAQRNLSAATLPEAIQLNRQAVAEDTRFALAYARLSYAESLLCWFRGASPDVSLDQARIDAEKALALQPDLMEAHLALAYDDYWGRLEFPSALEHLARAQALAPQSAEVLVSLGLVYRRQLRFDEAIAMFERAAQYDPGNSTLISYLARTYVLAGRSEKVQPTLERALALDPDNEFAAIQLAYFLINKHGDMEGARRVLRGGGPRLQVELAYTYRLTREYEKAIRLIEELPADSAVFGSDESSKDGLLGLYLHYMGQDERARPLLEPARDRLIASLADKALSPRRIAPTSIRLARIELALGNRERAVQVAERGAQSDAVTRDPVGRVTYRGDLAAIYAQVGRTDEAIALISELLKSSSVVSPITPNLLRLDPDFDPLREDSRFQALLKENSADGNEKIVKP